MASISQPPVLVVTTIDLEQTTEDRFLITDHYSDISWTLNLSEPEKTTNYSSMETSSANIAALVLLPMVMICGLVGNTLVCIAVFRFNSLRIVANYFIVSLAIADLAVCGIIMPLAAIQELAGSWQLGAIMCDIWVCLDVLMSTASIWNLCVIALDRYMAITRPVWYALHRTTFMASVAIAVAWVLSFLLSIPAYLFVGGFDESDAGLCELNISPVFGIISSMVSFYIPCVIVLIVYQRILIAARHHTRRRVRPTALSVSTAHPATAKASTRGHCNQSSQVSSSGNTCTLTQGNVNEGNENNNASSSNSDANASVINLDSPAANNDSNSNTSKENNETVDTANSNVDNKADDEKQTNNADKNVKRVTVVTSEGPVSVGPHAGNHHHVYVRRRQISVTRERRAAFVLAIVVGVFICCWLPFFIINVFRSICPTCYVPPVAFQVVTWLGWCNSILNPIIYTTFNREFRNAFKKIMFCGKL